MKRRHYRAVEAQPGSPARLGFGAGREAGTGTVWGSASAAATPAGAESADRSHAGEGQTDGGVNSEPVVLAAPRAGGWRGSRRMCTVGARPQAKWQR